MSVAQTATEQRMQPEVGGAHAQESARGAKLSAEQVEQLTRQAEGKEAKGKRTPGLKFVDGAVYAGVTHFGVFAISVVFTYLTRHGNAIGGKFPNWMQNRSNKVIDMMTNKGMKEQTAKDLTVVGFSFLDGCLLLPFVRLLESQRTRIAYAVDKVMGKVPKKTQPDGKVVDDMGIYEREPKQGWASIIAGRVAAASLVVPIAMGLDKWTPSKNKVHADGTQKNFNDIVMRDFGYKIADKIQDKALGKAIIAKADGFFEKRHAKLPDAQSKTGVKLKPDTPYKLKLPEFMEVNVFETVWTAICAAVLFATSRSTAKFLEKRKEAKAETAHAQPKAGGEKPAEKEAHQSVKHEEKGKAEPHAAPVAQEAAKPQVHASVKAGEAEAPKKSHVESVQAGKVEPKTEQAHSAQLTEQEQKAWADFVKENPKLAEQAMKVMGSQLERVQQRETVAAGAARSV